MGSLVVANESYDEPGVYWIQHTLKDLEGGVDNKVATASKRR